MTIDINRYALLQKQQKMTTTKQTNEPPPGAGLTSRRALIGALAAAPVVGVPLLARAAAIEPDPIFALIEAASLARAKSEEAYEIHDGLCDQFYPTFPPPVGKVTAFGRQSESYSRDGLMHLMNQAKIVEADPAGREVEYRAYDAKREAFGLNAAEERWQELTNARWEAEDAVLNARPRSHAGVFALLMFTAEYLADDMCTNTCKIVPVFVNAARSMRAIAGDTEALTISKELAEVLSGDRV